MEINLWVLVNKDCSENNSYILNAAKSQCPVLVYRVYDDTVCCKTVDMYFNNFQPNPFNISKSQLTVISSEKAEKLDRKSVV